MSDLSPLCATIFGAETQLRAVAKLVAYGTAAVKPSLFGLGPIPVVRQALAWAGWSNGDVGRVEINEAFEATALAVILGRPPDIVNVEGGAIARGHPIGATSDPSSPFDTSRRPQERCRRREVSCAQNAAITKRTTIFKKYEQARVSMSVTSD
jgi:hypothetical protein